MKLKRKFKIEKLKFPMDDGIGGKVKYNVQQLFSSDNGKSYYYCGFGKFCRTRKEVIIYMLLEKYEEAAKNVRKNLELFTRR